MEYSNESLIELANYFGEDPTIACEGAKEFIIKVKEKVTNACNRIVNFITHLREWLKGKFAAFLKKSVVTINKSLWHAANNILNLITKPTICAFHMDALEKMHTEITHDMYGKANNQNTKADNYYTKAIEKLENTANELRAIESSKDYDFIFSFNNENDEKKDLIQISAQTLNRHERYFSADITSMLKDIAFMQLRKDKYTHKTFEYFTKKDAAEIKRCQIGMIVINKLMRENHTPVATVINN